MRQMVRMMWGLAVLVAGVALSLADGFRNPPEGAATLGRAGQRIVFGDDIESGAHNPAALADRVAPAVGGGVATVYGKRKFTSDRYGFTVRSTDRWAHLPSVFAVTPAGDGRYGVGMALTSPYGRSAQFSQGSPMRYLAPYAFQLRTVNLNPALGMRLSDRVAFGAGVSILWSDLEMRQLAPWSMVSGNPAAVGDGRITFDADGIGHGFNAGVTWDITDNQRAAMAYRSPVKVTYDGNMHVGPASGPVMMRDSFKTSLTFPAVLTAGYGIQATDVIRFEANIEWVRHSLFDEMKIDVEQYGDLLPAREIPADWRDNWTFGLGAEWQCSPELALRAGYMYLQSPVPSRTMIPLVAEADQSVVSIGAGYTRGAHRLDLAYMLGLIDQRRVDTNVNADYTGKYEFDAHLWAVGYTYTF